VSSILEPYAYNTTTLHLVAAYTLQIFAPILAFFFRAREEWL
jgi:hypothetical protein